MTAREVIRFPRPMKRGAKVRRGPCAQIFQFPAPLSGEALRVEWQWLGDHYDRWSDAKLPEPEDLAGVDRSKFDMRYGMRNAIRVAMGDEPMTEATMRRDVAEWRAQIEKRAQVKAWLESQGVDLKKAFEPERALFSAFDGLA